MNEFKIPKKLIESALPLDAINFAATREKSIRHGHPSTLHLYWARRPLAAARAVIFAQMVNDPGYERDLGRGMNKERAALERKRLFKILEDLVKWENTNDPSVLAAAKKEIMESWRETCALNKAHPRAHELFNPEKLPAFHDPFAGGGAIPLEAQRLGLASYASDLNPVAVVINKAMIEIPARFKSCNPVGPSVSEKDENEEFQFGDSPEGLAVDVERYGMWMYRQAKSKIENKYPRITISENLAKIRPDLKHLVGTELTVMAWLWARTVKSPNPAFSHVDVPLVSSFWLSKKDGKECWIEPLVTKNGYAFEIRTKGNPKIEGTVGRTGGTCLMSGAAIPLDYIRQCGRDGKIGKKLLAIVADGPQGKIYLAPNAEHESSATIDDNLWSPEIPIPAQALGFRVHNYGFKKFGELFTQRQLLALNTFSDLIGEVIELARRDAVRSGMNDDGKRLADGGTGAQAYAEAIGTYLSLVIDRLADYWSSFGRWQTSNQQLSNLFGRQAISMTWDFPEANPFSGKGGSFQNLLDWTIQSLPNIGNWGNGWAIQANAQTTDLCADKVISTDPPYYDNIGYADLSDFFYGWMKRNLSGIFPSLFSETAVPKAEELVATPFRHGGKKEAETFFLDGMTKTLSNLLQKGHPAFPITIYYAFKQSDTDEEGTQSTGWITFLDAVLKSGFAITGTWPMRTELSQRMRGIDANALASNIVLVCRKRPTHAQTVSRREFVRELNSILPEALEEITTKGEHSPVAPVDLSQAIIGPGMAIFSKYSAVLEADGKPMSVKTALQLINRFLAEDDFDHDTQFCLQWFETNGWQSGKFGEADVLARAKGTSVDGLKSAGVIESAAGTVRLYRPSELSPNWLPEFDSRVSIWELLHNMILGFTSSGESAAGQILSRASQFNETIRTLAYRLYTICERKGWAQDAGHYDSLVRAWDSIESEARAVGYSGTQIALFDSAPSTNESQSPTKAKSRKKK